MIQEEEMRNVLAYLFVITCPLFIIRNIFVVEELETL